MSKYRKKLSKKVSKRLFTRTAQKIHPRNYSRVTARGGIRM